MALGRQRRLNTTNIQEQPLNPTQTFSSNTNSPHTPTTPMSSAASTTINKSSLQEALEESNKTQDQLRACIEALETRGEESGTQQAIVDKIIQMLIASGTIPSTFYTSVCHSKPRHSYYDDAKLFEMRMGNDGEYLDMH